MDQAVEQFSDVKCIDLKGNIGDVDVLVVFGVGEGSVHKLLSSWIKKGEERFVVFVEDREPLFLEAREFPLAKDPRVRLFFYDGASEEIFSLISWEFVFLRYGYACTDPRDQERATAFFSQLQQFHRGVDLLASDSQDMGLKVLKNVLANLEHLPRSKIFQSLENSCAGIPAILCGAGASLNSAIPLLSELKDNAVIIAGGTAVRALDAQGISPHLSVHLDPDPPHRNFLEQDCFEAPVFFQGRFSSDALSTMHGAKVWVAESGNCPLEGWISAECGVFTEPLESGWTVSNLCAVIAAHLGCDPIICVGMDFSCGPEEVYASGVNAGKNADELIELQKDLLYSKNDWLMSAEWMGAFAEKNRDRRWINASSSGLELMGFEKGSLEALCEKELAVSWDIAGAVHRMVHGAPFSGVTAEKVDAVRKKIALSFERCSCLCDQLLKIWEKHYPHSPLEKGDYILAEVELEQEICHRYLLMPLWNVWKRPILRASFHPLGQHIQRLLFYKKAIEMHIRSYS